MAAVNDRTRERVMLAAANCTPDDDRQAAIIGGIVANLLADGHFLPQEAAKYAADRMGWGYSVARSHDRTLAERGDELGSEEFGSGPFEGRIFPQRGYPTMAEVRAAAEKFRAQYDPPAPMGVAS